MKKRCSKGHEGKEKNMQITLKAARVNAGLTQEQVEKETGFARSTLTRWENGKGFPRIDDLTTLCNLYGIPVENIKKK